MADTIKIGNLNISAFKVGNTDCNIYLGSTLLYSGGTTPPTPPSFDGKFKLTYQDESVYSAECDSSSAITSEDVQGSSSSHTAITEAEIGDCVTYIDTNAFEDCSSLTSVTIPNSVTYIEEMAFLLCESLPSITFPNSLTGFGRSAFDGCYALTSINIPSGVTSIPMDTFNNCISLSSITVDNNNTTYDSRNNCNAIIETSNNSLLFGCKNTVIPNTVTTLSAKSFFHCTGLTSVSIPDSVTTIGGNAFYACDNLSAITINNLQDCTITSLGNLLSGNSANIYTENCDVYAALTLYSNVPSNRIVSTIGSNFQTRWAQTQETMCNGGDSYWVDVQEYSCDGINWTPTTITQKGALKESGATECQGGNGYIYSSYRVYEASGDVTSTSSLVDTTDNVSISTDNTYMRLRYGDYAETSGRSGSYTITIDSNDKIDSICFIASSNSAGDTLYDSFDINGVADYYNLTTGTCVISYYSEDDEETLTKNSKYVLAKWNVEGEEPTNEFFSDIDNSFKFLAIGINQEDTWGEAYTVGNP